MATSGQFLTVPSSSSHRSSQHHRRDSARASAQSPRAQRSATRGVASSSKVKLEDTPLGIPGSTPASPPSPPPPPTTTPNPTTTTTKSTNAYSTSSSSPQSSPKTSQARRPARSATAPAASINIVPPASNPSVTPPQSVQLSPRSIFRAMPFLLRLRSPQSDLTTMTCTSGGPRTHAVLSKCQIDKAPQPLTYDKTIVCADAVNAEVLLRLARNELLELAQQANRQVTALVDEEWRYTIRQSKSGDYNVQVFYSARPAHCESQNSNVTVDPRKPVALSHITNIPGLMRVVNTE